RLRGHRAARPGPIRVTARPLSHAGINSVEWRVDGRRVATGRKRPFVWVWTTPAAGRHRITVRAIDAAGRRRTLGYTAVMPRATAVTPPGGVAGHPVAPPPAPPAPPPPPAPVPAPATPAPPPTTITPPAVERSRPYSDDFNA